MSLVRSQDKDSMNHTSQEWLNGVHLFFPTKMCFLFYQHLRKLLIFHKSHGKVTGWGGITTMTIAIGPVDRG